MTRGQQIIEEVKRIIAEAHKKGDNDPMADVVITLSFTLGARWADKNPHWISIEDSLPKINPNESEWEHSDDVVVALKDGSIAVGRYERDNSTGERYWVLYGVDKDLVVTHWMPLPAPPTYSEKPNNCEKGGEE